ncbi:unnamed protein product [Brassicogethes aeneus]|uniref:Uncharacterized protein n=1 Tax=Brassicogethes aeneus TaxID=1431903 RepID=A0A9P0FHX2_BRAAE|nr:unnamed protein product [Brassicogethes aeneus]
MTHYGQCVDTTYPLPDFGTQSPLKTTKILQPTLLNMESWLVDVKRVRIPRPKFGSGNRCYPAEPPKDYLYDERPEELKFKTNMVKVTEDLRRAFQEKL